MLTKTAPPRAVAHSGAAPPPSSLTDEDLSWEGELRINETVFLADWVLIFSARPAVVRATIKTRHPVACPLAVTCSRRCSGASMSGA
jgi:hypothetical protein